MQQAPYYAMKDFAEKSGLGALMSMPILLNGTAQGVITTYFSAADEISNERKQLAESLSRFAAHIVEIDRQSPFSITGGVEDALPVKLNKANGVKEAAAIICQYAAALSRCDAVALFEPEGALGVLSKHGEHGSAWILETDQVKALCSVAFSLGAVQNEALHPPELLGARFAAAFPCAVGKHRIGVLALVQHAINIGTLHEGGDEVLHQPGDDLDHLLHRS